MFFKCLDLWLSLICYWKQFMKLLPWWSMVFEAARICVPGTVVHNRLQSKLSLGPCEIRAVNTYHSLETVDKEFRATFPSQNWGSKGFSAFSCTLFDNLWPLGTYSFTLLCALTHPVLCPGFLLSLLLHGVWVVQKYHSRARTAFNQFVCVTIMRTMARPW